MPLLRLLCLLWFWPTLIGAAFTGLVFLVAFLLRDTGLVQPTVKSPNNNQLIATSLQTKKPRIKPKMPSMQEE
jgi:hypothetical protein